MISSSLGLHVMIYNFGRRLWRYQDQAESIDAAHLSLTLFKACPIFPNSTFSSVLHIPARSLDRKFLLQGILYKSCTRNARGQPGTQNLRKHRDLESEKKCWHQNLQSSWMIPNQSGGTPLDLETGSSQEPLVISTKKQKWNGNQRTKHSTRKRNAGINT